MSQLGFELARAHPIRKRPVPSRKVFEATAVIKFSVELSPDLDDAVEAAKYFLEEELGFANPRILCVEKRGRSKRHLPI
ncbi:MAG: hypothetical protein ACHQ9S_03010 [Candidatus Binatia bacterium]